MRTTLDIDEDVLQAVKEIGAMRCKTAGQVLSELARKGLTPLRSPRVRNGVPLRDEQLFKMSAARGHQHLTDVYLLGLAVKRGGRFVTFDHNVPLGAVKGARREVLAVISPVE